jgi:hypothetical protein
MNRTLFLLAALLFSGGVLFAQAEAPAAKQVEFKSRAHKKGDKIAFSTKEITTFAMTMSVMGQEQSQSNDEDSAITYSLEVLEVNKAGVVTKVKGKISAWTKREKSVVPQMGESETGLSDAQTSLIGKEFILNASASPANATDLEGNALPNDQVEALREEMLDKSNQVKALINELDTVIPSKVTVGETIKLDGNQVAKLLKVDDEEEAASQLGDPSDIFSGTLKLKEIRNVLGNKVGVFDVLIKLDASMQGAADMKAEPKGELHIGLDDKYVYKVDVIGKMTLNGSQVLPGPDGEEIELTITGGGDMKLNQQAIYSKAK